MSGSIEQKGDLFRVSWYWQGKRYRISRYHGEPMLSRRLAEKLLAAMQADVERGIFRIEKFIGEEFTDVSEYLDMWIEAIAHTLSPATIKDYRLSSPAGRFWPVRVKRLVSLFLEDLCQIKTDG